MLASSGCVTVFSGALVVAKASKQKSAPAAAKSSRPSFPRSVLQFSFAMSLSEVGNACENSGRLAHVRGALVDCTAKPGAADTSDVRIRFSAGKPAQITVIYHAPRAGLNAQYDALSGSLQTQYGRAQVPAPKWPAACSASLAACLAASEHPGGPVWHWPNGSIEVVPELRDGEALIDLKYTPENPNE